MQPGLSEVAGDVEADPGAVFEAHGAESVDELVADGGAAEGETAGDDSAVDRLFAEELSRPERRPDASRDRSHPGTSRADAGRGRSSAETGESVTKPSVLDDLERAIDASEGGDAPDLDDVGLQDLADGNLDALEDGDVADALAAAEELEDGELPVAVPEEWREE